MTRVLVLGAGELGLAILAAVSQHPARPETTILLRPSSSPARSALLVELKNLGVSPSYADLTSPDLYTHLAGYDIVVSATGFAAGPGTQRHICDAAIRAKVPWYVPWQFGVDYDKIGRGSSQPLFDEQLDVTALGGWDNQVTMTSAEDIGRLTANILLDESAHQATSRVEYVAGDTTTFQSLAKALKEMGWDVQQELLGEEDLQRARESRPDDVGPKYQLIWARGVGVAWDIGETWNALNGIQVEDMRAWIDANFEP